MAASRVPVVMIHGAFCGGWAFDSWRLLFEAAGYDVHTPNLRHHDGAEDNFQKLSGVSIRDYVADLEILLDGLPAKPILIGHSMGGLIAQMLAARRPVRALILLAPSAPWGVLPSTPFEFAAAQALYMGGDFWNRALPPLPWVAEVNALNNMPEDERGLVAEKLVPESGLATFEILQWGLDMTRATYIDARDVTCPILCLVGGRDRINAPATMRRVAQRYRGRARYEELPEHGHWLIGEPGWQMIVGAALAWLRELSAHEKAAAGTP